MNLVVWFICQGNLNLEGTDRRGKFIYCQYSRGAARFFVFGRQFGRQPWSCSMFSGLSWFCSTYLKVSGGYVSTLKSVYSYVWHIGCINCLKNSFSKSGVPKSRSQIVVATRCYVVASEICESPMPKFVSPQCRNLWVPNAEICEFPMPKIVSLQCRNLWVPSAELDSCHAPGAKNFEVVSSFSLDNLCIPSLKYIHIKIYLVLSRQKYLICFTTTRLLIFFRAKITRILTCDATDAVTFCMLIIYMCICQFKS
jgi:hypothetical protein